MMFRTLSLPYAVAAVAALGLWAVIGGNALAWLIGAWILAAPAALLYAKYGDAHRSARERAGRSALAGTNFGARRSAD